MVNGETVEQRQCHPIGDGGELTETALLAVVAERGATVWTARAAGSRRRCGAQTLLIAELEKFTGVGEDA